MRKEEVELGWFLLASAAIIVLFLCLKTLLLPTGLTVYEETTEEKNWDFGAPEEYIYTYSLIDVSNGGAALIPVTTDNLYTTEEASTASATAAILHQGENSQDKIAELHSQDGEFVNLQKAGDVLDVTFDASLDNGDTITLYLLQQNNVNTDIYLCDAGTACNSPGYGSVNFNEEEGWYNIIISGLPAPTNVLGIDPPNHIRIDYVAASYVATVSHSNTTTTYPSSAKIETDDFTPAAWSSWGTFSATETLNGQAISYYYSTDSGLTWIPVPANNDLSSVNNSRIRLKAILESDGTGTPTIESLSLSYTTQACTENWAVQYGECRIDDTQLKSYLDVNECGTTSNLPADNGTSTNCDYCTPSWQEINSSCTPGNVFTNSFQDQNNCYLATGLGNDNLPPSGTTYACGYCSLHNCTDSVDLPPTFQPAAGRTLWEVDAREETNTFLEIETAAEMNTLSDNVSIIHYSHNIKNETPSSAPLRRYVEIEPGAAANDNVVSIKIIIYYTDEEIAEANIDEGTIKIHYYNETRRAWEELNSTVNTAENFVYAIVNHFSLYGLFGGENEEESSDSGSSGSSSGGGGGSSRKSNEKKVPGAVAETIETILPTMGEEKTKLAGGSSMATELACHYVLEVSLPDEISFREEESFEGEIVNRGSCMLPLLSLKLSPELEEVAALSFSSLENLPEGNKSTFTLIRKQERKSGVFSFLTSSAVFSNLRGSKNITGTFTIEGKAEQQTVFQRELNLNIIIDAPLHVTSFALAGGGIIFLVLIVVLLAFFFRRRVVKQEKFKTEIS